MMGLPSLGPTLCDLSAAGMVIACIVALAVSATACAIAAFELVCSVAIIANLLVSFMLSILSLPSLDFLVT